jgi:hypothetical protein
MRLTKKRFAGIVTMIAAVGYGVYQLKSGNQETESVGEQATGHASAD